MPMSSSETLSITRFPDSCATLTRMRPPFGLYLIALLSKLPSTCSSRRRSDSRPGLVSIRLEVKLVPARDGLLVGDELTRELDQVHLLEAQAQLSPRLQRRRVDQVANLAVHGCGRRGNAFEAIDEPIRRWLASTCQAGQQ